MMQPESATAPYTILRIKRKRNEEPLDALVVESRVRRKKSRGGMDVFQFAHTVEDSDWEDDKRKKDLEVGSTFDEGRRIKKPPTVVSAKEVAKHNFKVYDAIPSPEKTRSPTEPASEIDKFIPLLNEYLSLHEIPLPAAHKQKKVEETKPAPDVRSKTTKPYDEGDYVWDVFYRRSTMAGVWGTSGNVATLTGLPPLDDELYDSSSESEFEDEADEDSNAEEYYKHDYPDEEDADRSGTSDEFHEDSDFDDFLHDQDDGGDWR